METITLGFSDLGRPARFAAATISGTTSEAGLARAKSVADQEGFSSNFRGGFFLDEVFLAFAIKPFLSLGDQRGFPDKTNGHDKINPMFFKVGQPFLVVPFNHGELL